MSDDPAEKRALTAGDAGALVPSDGLGDLTVDLYNRLTETAAALTLGVQVIETPHGRPWPIVTVGDQGTARGSVDELADTRDISQFTFSVAYLAAHKTVSTAVLPNELLQDTYVRDFDDEVVTLLADAVARDIDPLIFNGAGTTEPRGFVRDLRVIETAATPSFAELHAVTLSLDSKLLRQSGRLRWGMHRDVYERIVASRFATGDTAATAASAALRDGEPLTLWQYPVVLCNDMSSGSASGDRIAVFGDFGRAVRGRRWIDTAKSALSRQAFPLDQVEIRVTTRFDSRLVDNTAAVALAVK